MMEEAMFRCKRSFVTNSCHQSYSVAVDERSNIPTLGQAYKVKILTFGYAMSIKSHPLPSSPTSSPGLNIDSCIMRLVLPSIRRQSHLRLLTVGLKYPSCYVYWCRNCAVNSLQLCSCLIYSSCGLKRFSQ